MSIRPRSVDSADSFPYKEEILRALERGARCRKSPCVHPAGRLRGTYRIRLNIVRDPRLNDGIPEADNEIARDLATMVENLSVDPETEIAIYFIGPSEDGFRYDLMEYEETGGYVGCLRGRRSADEANHRPI